MKDGSIKNLDYKTYKNIAESAKQQLTEGDKITQFNNTPSYSTT